MGKTLSCKELGSIECTWEGKAETEEELIQLAKEHGRDAHDITEVSPELMEQMKAAIKDD